MQTKIIVEKNVFAKKGHHGSKAIENILSIMNF